MSDLYDTLSPAAQATVRTKLYASMLNKPCPTVDTTGITGPDSLNDAGNRAMAVDCFQTGTPLKGATVGMLDQPTYTALVGWFPALPLWQKMAGGAAIVGIGWFGYSHLKKRRRR